MSVDPFYSDYEEETDQSLDISEVNKFNWKSTMSRDFWDSYLKEFPDKFEEAKLQAVRDEEHPRKVLVKSLSEESLEELVEKSQEQGLEFWKMSDEDKVVLAREREVIEDFRDAREEGETGKILKLKGVPECCVEERQSTLERGIEDPIYEVACNSESAKSLDENGEEVQVEDPHPLLNKMWAYRGVRFVEHYPCSFECDESQELAKKNAEMMKENGDKELAEQVAGFLNSPMSWSGYHGLAHVKNGFSIGEYTTDDRWSEKIVIWMEEHENLKM
ncbi:MAG: hypothetical protein ACLFTA_03295 [Candidatus Nanohaloarchaea archaeon]